MPFPGMCNSCQRTGALSISRYALLNTPHSTAASYQPLVEACSSVGSGGVDAVLRAVAAVPHMALLPLCCAVVYHGGAGSTAAALTAGCSQLVCPLHFDQFAWVRLAQKQAIILNT